VDCFPQAGDLSSEKRKKQMKEILKFDVLPPNTVLTYEGHTKVPIAYLVLFGSIRVFKKDGASHIFSNDQKAADDAEDKNIMKQTELRAGKQNIAEDIAYGRLGPQVTQINANDITAVDAKLFLGFETHLEDFALYESCQYTIVTSATEPTAAYKVLPE